MDKSLAEKLAAMSEGGKKLSAIKKALVELVKKVDDISEVEQMAVELIEKSGGEASFKMVPGYKWATCININEGVVHGIPKGEISDGDLVTIDTGLFYKGFHTDSAVSFVRGEASDEQKMFLEVGQRVLTKAIAAVKSGGKVGDISKVIQQGVEGAGYSVVRELTGHGVGEELHDEPPIPCYVSNGPEMSYKLEEGMTLAIEVMYTAGSWPLELDDDGWTLKTKDGSMAAVFEDSVFVGQKGAVVLTS